MEAIKKIVVHYCHGPKQNDDDFPMIMEAKWEMYKCLRFLLNCEKQDFVNIKCKVKGKWKIKYCISFGLCNVMHSNI